MVLTFEQIRSITRGIVRMEVVDGLIHFHRFTEAQYQLYQQQHTDIFPKAASTSGVVLEFDTDSRSLSLDTYVTGGDSQRFVCHSIFINGQPGGQLGDTVPGNMGSIDMQGSFYLGEGMKRVKICMPWAANSQLRALILDDGAALIPVQKEKTVLLFGDSITQGYEAALPENTYASRLTQWLDWNAINKGIGGEIFWPELAALSEDFTPDLINVAYGTNDWSVCSFEELENNCRGFYHNLRKTYPDTKIVMLSPIWRDDMNREDSACPFRQVAQLLRTIAEEIGNAVLIDCFDFVPPENRCFCADLLHPSDEGFRHYAEGLIRCYEALGLNK